MKGLTCLDLWTEEAVSSKQVNDLLALAHQLRVLAAGPRTEFTGELLELARKCEARAAALEREDNPSGT